jgi:hypothetical protein
MRLVIRWHAPLYSPAADSSEMSERLGEQRFVSQQLLCVIKRQTLEEQVALLCQSDQYSAPVSCRLMTHSKPGSFQAIDELNRSVMLHQHLIGEFADHDGFGAVNFDRQQRLVLP